MTLLKIQDNKTFAESKRTTRNLLKEIFLFFSTNTKNIPADKMNGITNVISLEILFKNIQYDP